jgi:hypothetical protein
VTINLDALGLEQEDKPVGDPARRLADQLIAGKSREELLQLAGAFTRISAKAENKAGTADNEPQTPDELWDYIVHRYGARIARVAVCDDHDTPFDYVCAGFFETYPNIFGIGPRGGGKSWDQALLHELNSHWKPGCESATFGAVEEQAKRVYAAFKTFVNRDEIIGEPKISETNYKPVGDMNYGSKVEVLGGTLAAVNGPHPCSPGDELVLTFDGYKPIAELDSQRDRLASYFPTNKYLTWGTIHGKIKRGLSEVGVHYDSRGYWVAQTATGASGGRGWGGKYDTEAEAVQAIRSHRHDNVKIAFPFSVGKRFYSGPLVIIDTEQGKTRVTPNHVVRAKFLNMELSQKWVVYVMNRGNWWRVGKTRGGRLVNRLNEENADGLWAIGVFDSQDDALHHEAVVQAKHGLTGICFERNSQNGRIITPSVIHDALAGQSSIRSEALLRSMGMDPKTPLVYKKAFNTTGNSRRFVNGIWFDTAAGNLAALSGCVVVPGVPPAFAQGGNKQPCIESVATISSQPFSGMVYSLDIQPYHYYVSGGHVVHNCKSHSDEVEIMRADTWRESRNLAAAKTTPDGRHIKAQNYGTSTMKWKGGRVWQILESFRRAKEKAIERFGDNKELVDDMVTKTTQFYVLTWCIFEVAEQVPNCREVPENDHLPEWEPGLDRADCKCDCHEIVNSTLEAQDENGDPLPRTLASECQGRFYRSRGHRTRDEVIQLFLQNDPRTWRAQQLCRDTESEGLYLPGFSRNRHGLARFGLDTANGPIYSGTDWGFVDEAAVVWIQYLERAIEAIRYDGKTVVLPRGARVAFSELTIARKTATELGQLAIMREIKLANVMSISRVPVRKRWADLQGAGDRRDWAKMGLKSAKYSTRNFDEHVKEWRGLVDADRFYVVIDEDRFTGLGCPALADQMEGWREEDGKESREQPQHVVSGARYCLYGMHDIYNDSGAQSPEQVEVQKMLVTAGAAPVAKPFASQRNSDEHRALAAETGWRARV